MRKHTAPGVAPPAPGAVCPRVPARSGEWTGPEQGLGSYRATADDVSQDDIDTRPDNTVDPDLLKLVRLIDSMPPVERRRFVSMAENFTRCSLGKRVLIEELARELGAKT